MKGPELKRRAQRRVVTIRMRELQIVARHRLMNRQVLDRPRVVLAQERLHLFVGPVRGDRRYGVESFLSLVERARRIAVRQRHAALELRHRNDFERIVVHRHEVLRAHECERGLVCLARGVEYFRSRRMFGVGDLERGHDCSLLSRSVRTGRRRGSTGALGQYCARDLVHLGACGRATRVPRVPGSAGVTTANPARTRASGRRDRHRCGSRPSLPARVACRAISGVARRPCAPCRWCS